MSDVKVLCKGVAAWGRVVTIVYFVRCSNEHSPARGCGTKGECVCDVILVCVYCDPGQCLDNW